MAAISITPENIEQISAAALKRHVSGAALTGGLAVYKNTSDGNKLYIADYSAAATAIVEGIIMFKASSGSYGWVASTTGMEIAIGGTSAAGVEYYLGASGAIVLRSDVTTGKFVTKICTGKTTANVLIDIFASGVASA